MRKEPHEEREVQEPVGRFQDPPVDVDRVGHRLKRVEADPDREDDAQWGCRHRDAEIGEDVDEGVNEEVGVLEEAQHSEVGAEAAPQQKSAASLIRGPVERPSGHEVDQGGYPDQRQEPPVPPAVEGVASHQHRGLPRRGPGQQGRVGGQD